MLHASFLKALRIISAAYPSWKLDEETIQIWNAILSDTPPDSVLRAALEWVRTPAEFPPTVGQIRALATKPAEAALAPEEAWGEVMGEIRRVGWNGTPVWSSEAISRAARALGSWRTLCSQRTDELVSNRAHFFRIYAAFSAKQTRGAEQLAMAPIMELMTGSKANLLKSPEEMYGASKAELDADDAPDLEAEDERLRRYELGEDLDVEPE